MARRADRLLRQPEDYCERKGLDFERFVKPGGGTEMVHFIGKDIIYFHTLFWPAMLEFSGYKAPTMSTCTASSRSRATMIPSRAAPASARCATSSSA